MKDNSRGFANHSNLKIKKTGMYIKSLKQKIAIHIALLIDGLSRTSDKSPSASRIDRQTRVGT